MTSFPALSYPLGLRRVLSVNVKSTMRGNMVTARTWRDRHVRHTYEIPWMTLTNANKLTLVAFFAACQGSYLNDIAYVDPWDGLTYTCRLDTDVLALQNSQTVYGTTLRLVEVANWKALKSPVATFPVVPFQYPARLSVTHRTELGIAEDGSTLAYPDFTSGIHSFGVGGDALVDVQALALLNCWEGNGGPYKEFVFTDLHTGTVYPHAHFVENELTHTLVILGGGGKVHSIRCNVEELK